MTTKNTTTLPSSYPNVRLSAPFWHNCGVVTDNHKRVVADIDPAGILSRGVRKTIGEAIVAALNKKYQR